ADADFGGTYGLLSQFLKSRVTNPATSGLVRLAKTDALSWRNNANTGNVSLSIDSSDLLVFNGLSVATGNCLDVQQFGAHPGGRAAANTAGIQAAINACHEGGGVILTPSPSGLTYSINDNIILNKPIFFGGLSNGIILSQTNSTKAVVKTQA